MNKLARWASVFLVIPLALTACEVSGSTPADQSGANTIPTPLSKLIGRFVWQTDGPCGYRMLRPQAWEAAEAECRSYKWSAGENQSDRLVLQVSNYEVIAQHMSAGILVQYELFKQNPSLADWTQAIGQTWKSDGIQFTPLESAPRAKVYSIRPPGSSDVQIAAFLVDENQPLGVGLNASGAYASLERLQREGILDDFKIILESIHAIPYDPQNIDPPLNSH